MKTISQMTVVALLFAAFMSTLRKASGAGFGTFKRIVYDITNNKDAIVAGMCDNKDTENEWDLPDKLYLRLQHIKGRSELLPKPIDFIARDCLSEDLSLDFIIFFNSHNLCDINNSSFLGGNFTVRVQPNDSDNIEKIDRNCTSLCMFLICAFKDYKENVGLEIEIRYIECLFASCPYVFQKMGFLVQTIELDNVASMLSYGGFQRVFEPINDRHVYLWSQENPLGDFYVHITVNTSVGLDIEKIDKVHNLLQTYTSSWFIGESWWTYLVILESSKSYQEPDPYAFYDHSKNSTVYPKIPTGEGNNLDNFTSLCRFWHRINAATKDFNQFFMHVDRWESTALLVEDAKSVCNIVLNPKTSILIYGTENLTYVEELKNRTSRVNYTFPALTYLVTETLDDTLQNVLYIKSIVEVSSRFTSQNTALPQPMIIVLSNELSAQEEITPALPKLDGLLKLQTALERNYSLTNATFFIEFNITDQTEEILSKTGSFETNLFCWDDLVKVKQLQDGLTNWSWIHNFKVIPFPVVNSKKELGWTYDVITTPTLKKENKGFTTTIRRNTAYYVGRYGTSSSCVDKCIRNDCGPNFEANSYSGVTLNLDSHLQHVNLTDTNIKNFLLLAFNEYNIVELLVRDMNLANQVFQLLNYDLKKEISNRVQREVDEIVLFISVYENNDVLLRATADTNSSFSPVGVSFIKWEAEENETPDPSQLPFEAGIEVEDCTNEINFGLASIKTHPLFSVAKYILCPVSGFLETKSGDPANEEKFQIFLDTHLFIKDYFKFSLNKDTFFRVSFRNVCNTESDATKFNYFKYFLTEYADLHGIHYFVGDVFLNCSEYRITNYNDLLSASSYEFVNRRINMNIKHPDVPLFAEPLASLIHRPSNVPLMVGVPVLVVFTISTITAVYMYFKNRKRKLLSTDEVDAFLNGEEMEVTNESIGVPYEQVNTVRSLGFNKSFQMSKKDLSFGARIGAGNFGEVFHAVYMQDLNVAVKLPNSDCSKAAFKTMLSEVKVLSYLGEHANVLRFVGAYTKEIDVGLIYIATEFCENGTLEMSLRNIRKTCNQGDFLYANSPSSSSQSIFVNMQNSRAGYSTLGPGDSSSQGDSSGEFYQVSLHSNFETLCRYAMEIASGMDYISAKKVVHSDLSARNVLLADNFVCKIADFGLSRKLYERSAYIKHGEEGLPWRWMAIESLRRMEFTTKSDVWSYGVTLWEIFSLGEVPFSGMVWNPSFTSLLEEGLRLSKPELASDEIFKQMCLCWNIEAADRPGFDEMQHFFQGIPLYCNDDASYSTC